MEGPLMERVVTQLLDQTDALKQRVNELELQPSGEPTGSNVIAVGSKFPDVNLQQWKNPEAPALVNVPERLSGKTVIMLGLPGAFTPC
jgi:hypothetical protein